MSDLEFFKGSRLFKNLNDDELKIISSLFVEQRHKKNSLILRQGDAAEFMYLVRDGMVKITKLTMDGREKIAGFLNKGDFFGEICILIGKERCINARAMTDCWLAAMSRDDTIAVMERIPKIAFNFINMLCSRLVEADHYVNALLFKDVKERISDQLYELSKEHGSYTNTGLLINLKLTHQSLADMIGISRESVTRGIKELRREGIIKHIKNKQFLIDMSPFKTIEKNH
jgi:CRP/FNR family transcriptional regulator